MVKPAISAHGGFAPMAQRLEEARTSDIGPGLIAFTIVVLLAIATFFLLRSMMHHIRKVPPTFDDEPVDGPPNGSSGSDVG